MSIGVIETGASSGSVPRQGRIRLGFLDGMRGITALFVVLHHVWIAPPTSYFHQFPFWYRIFGKLLDHGHYAVDVFIVLSGYCLMLPVVRHPNGELKGGIAGFVQRRSRRILPPYYAAFGLSLALVALSPRLQSPIGAQWDVSLPVFAWGAILSHLVLVHNLSSHWIWTINGPLWSVATEWHIYFVFALILLPLRRLVGTTKTAMLAVVVSAAPFILFPSFHKLERACFWYIGLFAIGMVAAELDSQTRDMRRRPLLIAISVVTITVAILVAYGHAGTNRPKVVADILIGIATAAFIMSCSCTITSEVRERSYLPLRLLNHPVAQQLGEFSYSLYLVHYPILSWICAWLMSLRLTPEVFAPVFMGLSTPVCLTAAYLFYVAFERPCLRRGST